jgi:hypothetical protein
MESIRTSWHICLDVDSEQGRSIFFMLRRPLKLYAKLYKLPKDGSILLRWCLCFVYALRVDINVRQL